jgi:hypothetical protein
VGSTQHSSQCVSEAHSLRVKRTGREADHSLLSGVEVKMLGTTPHLLQFNGAVFNYERGQFYILVSSEGMEKITRIASQ